MEHICTLYWQWCSDDLRQQQLASLSSTGLGVVGERQVGKLDFFFIWRRFVLVPGSVRSSLHYDRPSRNSFRNHSFHNCRNCHAKHKRHENEIAPTVHSGLHTITITTTRNRDGANILARNHFDRMSLPDQWPLSSTHSCTHRAVILYCYTVLLYCYTVLTGLVNTVNTTVSRCGLLTGVSTVSTKSTSSVTKQHTHFHLRYITPFFSEMLC